jgi:hypothetical protein
MSTPGSGSMSMYQGKDYNNTKELRLNIRKGYETKIAHARPYQITSELFGFRGWSVESLFW